MYYFAYGSNMSLRRLRARVPSAVNYGIASLYGHSLRFHKCGRDGSAKCDALLTREPSHRVLGVVYQIDPADRPGLDRHEGLGQGYAAKRVQLFLAGGERIEAFTYTATLTDPNLHPFTWYKEHVLRGALEHGLDADYIQSIREVDTRVDTDLEREARELAIYRL